MLERSEDSIYFWDVPELEGYEEDPDESDYPEDSEESDDLDPEELFLLSLKDSILSVSSEGALAFFGLFFYSYNACLCRSIY